MYKYIPIILSTVFRCNLRWFARRIIKHSMRPVIYAGRYSFLCAARTVVGIISRRLKSISWCLYKYKYILSSRIGIHGFSPRSFKSRSLIASRAVWIIDTIMTLAIGTTSLCSLITHIVALASASGVRTFMPQRIDCRGDRRETTSEGVPGKILSSVRSIGLTAD